MQLLATILLPIAFLLLVVGIPVWRVVSEKARTEGPARAAVAELAAWFGAAMADHENLQVNISVDGLIIGVVVPPSSGWASFRLPGRVPLAADVITTTRPGGRGAADLTGQRVLVLGPEGAEWFFQDGDAPVLPDDLYPAMDRLGCTWLTLQSDRGVLSGLPLSSRTPAQLQADLRPMVSAWRSLLTLGHPGERKG